LVSAWTPAVVSATAAWRAALRRGGHGLWSQRVVVAASGEAGYLCARVVTRILRDAGMSPGEAARRLFWVQDGALVEQSASTEEGAFGTPPEAMFGWSFSGPVPTLDDTAACVGATSILSFGSASALSDRALRTLAAATPPGVLVAMGGAEGPPTLTASQRRALSGAAEVVLGGSTTSDPRCAVVSRAASTARQVLHARGLTDAGIVAATAFLARAADESPPLAADVRRMAEEIVRAELRDGATVTDLRFGDVGAAIDAVWSNGGRTTEGGA